MAWFDVLKLLSPRTFLEYFSEKLGGKVSGTGIKSSDNFKLSHEGGFIKVERRGRGEYYINVNNNVIAHDYNLESLKDITEKHIDNMLEKEAVAVTTQSAPNLFNHGKSMRDSNGKEDEEE
tara:strand:+ start:17 stop:379 length:363 start_codon:yes stop_codon:yes gene_type:complete